MSYSWELWDLMKKFKGLRCSTMQVEQYCQKPFEVPLDQLARPSELQNGSSEQTECNQKFPIARSTERAPILVERRF